MFPIARSLLAQKYIVQAEIKWINPVSPREMHKRISEERHLPNFLDNKGSLKDISGCVDNMEMSKISWDQSHEDF